MAQAQRLSELVSDYWCGPSVEHIEQWLNQFDEELRLPLASELTHILARSYFTAKQTKKFLKGLISTPQLVGEDPAAYWKKANFFNKQKGGESQHEFLELFDALLRSECGYGWG